MYMEQWYRIVPSYKLNLVVVFSSTYKQTLRALCQGTLKIYKSLTNNLKLRFQILFLNNVSEMKTSFGDLRFTTVVEWVKRKVKSQPLDRKMSGIPSLSGKSEFWRSEQYYTDTREGKAQTSGTTT